MLGHWQARLRHPGTALAQQRQLLDSRVQQLSLLMQNQLRSHRSALINWNNKLESHHPGRNIEQLASLLTQRKRELLQLIRSNLRRYRATLDQHEQLLTTLGPENTLARGYALVTGPDGQIIRNTTDAPIHSEVQIRLAKGELTAKVVATPEDEASDTKP